LRLLLLLLLLLLLPKRVLWNASNDSDQRDPSQIGKPSLSV
jgi:hypothetical protein